MEGIFVGPVHTMEDPILSFFSVNTLAGDPLCLTVVLLLLLAASQGGRASDELAITTICIFWTGLFLPFILLAPGQLSLTAGVSGADGWSVSVSPSVHLPLFDADAGGMPHGIC